MHFYWHKEFKATGVLDLYILYTQYTFSSRKLPLHSCWQGSHFKGNCRLNGCKRGSTTRFSHNMKHPPHTANTFQALPDSWLHTWSSWSSSSIPVKSLSTSKISPEDYDGSWLGCLSKCHCSTTVTWWHISTDFLGLSAETSYIHVGKAGVHSTARRK